MVIQSVTALRPKSVNAPILCCRFSLIYAKNAEFGQNIQITRIKAISLVIFLDMALRKN